MDNASDLSQRVLVAAKDLFFAKGFVRTQLRAIAAEAGTSESGILRVYQSKGGLLRAVYAACWADLNAHVDEAIGLASEQDPDPRNLLVELTRAVLEYYQANPAMMTFLCGHFGFRESTGLGEKEGVDPSVNVRLRGEYHRYLQRIHGICSAIGERYPNLERSGVGVAALNEFATSIIYGIQTSWYMADQDPGAAMGKVTINEVISALRFFLYQDIADKLVAV